VAQPGALLWGAMLGWRAPDATSTVEAPPGGALIGLMARM
jgi:hypothetical protein